MNWRELIEKGAAYLESRRVPEARVAMELIMARLLKCGRGFISARLDEIPPERFVEAVRRAMSRLVRNEPIQYVPGEWDFRKLTLKCDRRALIPRPETEELVTRVLAHLRSCTGEPRVVDVGTGTGCIVLSLASEFPDAKYLGIDISSGAIALARENAALCGLADKVQFLVADGLDDFDEPESLDVIVSNPPYVPSAECDVLDPRIRDFEPRLALDGGPRGLDFYNRLAMDALNLLRPGGAIFFEIGDGQGSALQKLLFDTGFVDIRVEQDFAGHDRYASAVMPR